MEFFEDSLLFSSVPGLLVFPLFTIATREILLQPFDLSLLLPPDRLHFQLEVFLNQRVDLVLDVKHLAQLIHTALDSRQALENFILRDLLARGAPVSHVMTQIHAIA